MRYRRYGDLIRSLDIDYCRGIDATGNYCDLDHIVGEAHPGRVHLADLATTSSGVYRALKLVSLAQHPEFNDEPPWRRTYLVNLAVRDLARQARIRVPARHVRMDRRYVLAGVAGLPNSVRLRRDAYHWARKVAYE